MADDRTEFVPGTLEMLVLRVLGGGRMHGYAIARRLQDTSENVLRGVEGTLYPALHRMERKGWVASSWGASEANRRARFYRITPKGRKRLGERTAAWQRVSAAIERVLRAAPGEA
jgi:PadR family transcriptional regulator PadR